MHQLWLVAVGVGHLALWVEVINRTHGVGWSKRVVEAWTLCCAVGLFLTPAVAWWLGAGRAGSTPWPLIAYGLICLAGLAFSLAQRFGVGDSAKRDPRVQRVNRESLDLGRALGRSATGSATLASIAAWPGNQLLRVSLEHRLHPLERLPEELTGLKVAHLTDLHMSGRLSRAFYERMVDSVIEWEPDLVCVTGDIVEHPAQLQWVKPTLGRFRPRLGSYFILGNHDRYAGAREVRDHMTAAGFVDLGGGLHRVAGAPLVLCGDERPWFPGEPPLADDEPFVICLAHTPDRFGWAVEREIDLVLAGHCHGGQVCFPGLGPLLCPSKHGVRYAAGSFLKRSTAMHVSRGSGSLFPVRLGCPPEVGLMTLTRAEP